ncbi:MAG: alkaline phosphatase family protein [Candidatus Cloacimonadales bacterium]
MAKKCILLLLDGLGDRAFACLQGQTPLQAAATPNLDQLAARGSNGLYHASKLGEPLPSEYAHLIMFGYQEKDYPGRGPLEALGHDLPLQLTDVAFLARFVEIQAQEDHFIVSNRWPQLPEEVIKQFCEKINQHDPASMSYKRMKKTFGILKFAHTFSDKITDTDPIIEGLPLYKAQPLWEQRTDQKVFKTTRYLNKLSRWCLDNLQYEGKTYALATQRSGKLLKIPGFYQTNGLQGLSISSGKIYKGLAQYIQIDFLEVTDSDDACQDYQERIQMAITNLEKYSFIHVHTKLPDKAAHQKDAKLKKDMIEQLDKAIGKMLPQLLQKDILLVISADHSTPSCGEMLHSGEPVPLIFVGENVRRDLVKQYDEVSAACGCLGLMRGGEFMEMILNYLDKARLYGFRETQKKRKYWPASSQPLTLSWD